MRLTLPNRLYNNSTSKGNQIKFFKDNKYYKVDTLGYESLAEVIISKILDDSGVFHISYELEEVLYEVKPDCFEEGIASVSENFREVGNQLIPLGRLLSILQVDINSKKFNQKSLVDKIDIVLNTVDNVYPKELFRQYLANLFYIDKIFLNEDRHFNNILFIKDQHNKFELSPIFDNGLGLLSSYADIESLNTPISTLIKKIKAKPFCTDFEKQCRLIGIPNTKIVIHLKEIEDFIEDLPYSDIIKKRVLSILGLQIRKYNLDKENTLFHYPVFGKEG